MVRAGSHGHGCVSLAWNATWPSAEVPVLDLLRWMPAQCNLVEAFIIIILITVQLIFIN